MKIQLSYFDRVVHVTEEAFDRSVVDRTPHDQAGSQQHPEQSQCGHPDCNHVDQVQSRPEQDSREQSGRNQIILNEHSLEPLSRDVVSDNVDGASGRGVTHVVGTRQQFEHLKVPRQNQTWLRCPSEAIASRQVTQNAELIGGAQLDIQGRSLSQLRQWTRADVVNAASQYGKLWDAPTVTLPPLETANWVVGGHQPTLFHPGVWAKNFAVSRLAAGTGSVGLNLVVDNDTMSSSAIRVPSGSFERISTTDVAFDLPQPKQPWENIAVQDRALFQSFPGRVRECLQAWEFTPLLEHFWPQVLKLQQSTPRLADAFTAARSLQEREWSGGNLELPLSHLCQLPSFLWFTSHILAHLSRFQDVYNTAVREYRIRNGIHSTSHPVPELAVQGDWLEAPFWVWRTGEQRRSRLFAQQRGRTLVLGKDTGEVLVELQLDQESDAQLAVDRLREIESQGIHIRTRALTTTLFSRICLADLFVHGIGGAKYDEITDQIISNFLGLPVPAYWIVSGTLHLPLGFHSVSEVDLVRVQRRAWDLKWNPTRALADHPESEVQELCAEFKERLHLPAARLADRKIRHRELSRIKTALSKWSREELPQNRQENEQITRQLAANRILQSREFSSVLYPEPLLKSFLNSEE